MGSKKKSKDSILDAKHKIHPNVLSGLKTAVVAIGFVVTAVLVWGPASMQSNKAAAVVILVTIITLVILVYFVDSFNVGTRINAMIEATKKILGGHLRSRKMITASYEELEEMGREESLKERDPE